MILEIDQIFNFLDRKALPWRWNFFYLVLHRTAETDRWEANRSDGENTGQHNKKWSL